MEISWGPPWRQRWPTICITSQPMKFRLWFRNIVADIIYYMDFTWTDKHCGAVIWTRNQRDLQLLLMFIQISCYLVCPESGHFLYCICIQTGMHIDYSLTSLIFIFMPVCWEWVLMSCDLYQKLYTVSFETCCDLVFCKQIQYCNWLSHYLGAVVMQYNILD